MISFVRIILLHQAKCFLTGSRITDLEGNELHCELISTLTVYLSQRKKMAQYNIAII